MYSTVVPRPTLLLSCISLSQRSGQVLSGLSEDPTCVNHVDVLTVRSVFPSNVHINILGGLPCRLESLRLKFTNEPSIFVDGDLVELKESNMSAQVSLQYLIFSPRNNPDLADSRSKRRQFLRNWLVCAFTITEIESALYLRPKRQTLKNGCEVQVNEPTGANFPVAGWAVRARHQFNHKDQVVAESRDRKMAGFTVGLSCDLHVWKTRNCEHVLHFVEVGDWLPGLPNLQTQLKSIPHWCKIFV